jgi:hypothetical protein
MRIRKNLTNEEKQTKTKEKLYNEEMNYIIKRECSSRDQKRIRKKKNLKNEDNTSRGLKDQN